MYSKGKPVFSDRDCYYPDEHREDRKGIIQGEYDIWWPFDISWTPYVIGKIEKLTQEWEQAALSAEEKKLEGVIAAALENFKFNNDKETWLNLAGEFSKDIPGADNIYSDISPAGATEEHHLFVNFVEFKFNDKDIERVKRASIKEARETFKPGYNTQFTTWLYKIFYNNLQDLYRNYQAQMKRGQILSSIDDYSEHKLTREQALESALHYIRQETWEQLNTYQKEWLILYYQVDPNRLEYKLMAEILEPDKSPAAREQREYRERIKLRAMFEPTIREQGITGRNTAGCSDTVPAKVCSECVDLEPSPCRHRDDYSKHSPAWEHYPTRCHCVEYKIIKRHEKRYCLRTWPQLSREHIQRRQDYHDYINMSAQIE